jgi:ribosome-associated heat shock protein Hsp15
MTTRDEERPPPAGGQRLDKWLWFARIAKSRTLAAALVSEGKVRVNRVRAAKASQIVRRGDVLTITLRGRVDVLKVLAAGERRGPPELARQLYERIATAGPTDPRDASSNSNSHGSGS